MNAPDRPVILWDCDYGAETLHHSTMDEAIEAELDQNWDQDEEGQKIKVYGYARMIAPGINVEPFLEEFFERQWEELQDEDGVDVTAGMRFAAETFLDTMHQEFVPWACEQVTSEEIDVSAWIKEHRPDWLKDRP